jgi:hypothetical protein
MTSGAPFLVIRVALENLFLSIASGHTYLLVEKRRVLSH